MEGKDSIKYARTSSSTNGEFDDRLHAKLKSGHEQDDVEPPPASTPMTANEKFEKRLKKKMEAEQSRMLP